MNPLHPPADDRGGRDAHSHSPTSLNSAGTAYVLCAKFATRNGHPPPPPPRLVESTIDIGPSDAEVPIAYFNAVDDDDDAAAIMLHVVVGNDRVVGIIELVGA